MFLFWILNKKKYAWKKYFAENDEGDKVKIKCENGKYKVHFHLITDIDRIIEQFSCNPHFCVAYTIHIYICYKYKENYEFSD